MPTACTCAAWGTGGRDEIFINPPAARGAGASLTYEIACMSCGTSLYSGFDLRSPNDVLKAAGYKCKKCGTKLSVAKYAVEVRKIDGSFS